MSAERCNELAAPKQILELRAAAHHCGLLPKVFSQWVRCGILPPADWTKEVLDAALDGFERIGVVTGPNASRGNTLKIPNVHRVARRNTVGIVRYHYFRRGVRGPLPGKLGSAEFMRSLLEKERQITARVVATPKVADRDGAPAPTNSPSIANDVLSASRTAAPQVERSTSSLAMPSHELLSVEQLVARYKGRIAEGTWRNHRSSGTGPPYVKIFREIFYPLEWLIKWERRNMIWCDLRGARDRDEEAV
jgi:hypothetical protein